MFIRRSGTSPAHHQYQQCHRFTQTSRMRSPFEPKNSFGFGKETLGQNERITLRASSLMKPLLFTVAVSLIHFSKVLFVHQRYHVNT